MYTVKKNKNRISLFVFSFFIIVISGCSWFYESSTEARNESYEAGNKALNEGRYDEATSYYRKISRSSPFYPQALWMIQKVPFKKGVASFEQEKFQIAIEELSKVPRHSPDYEEAQRYLMLTNYKLLLQKYLKSSNKERFYMIKDLVDISNELGSSKLLLGNISLIENELKVRTTKKKTKYLINLLWSIVELSDEKQLYKRTLNYLLKDFENFNDQPEVKSLVFQIIGNIKITLM